MSTDSTARYNIFARWHYLEYRETQWYYDPYARLVALSIVEHCAWDKLEFKGIELKPGQTWTSIRALARWTCLSERRVRTALDRLIQDNFVTQQATHSGTLLSITNYKPYGRAGAEANTPSTQGNFATQQTTQPTATKQRTCDDGCDETDALCVAATAHTRIDINKQDKREEEEAAGKPALSLSRIMEKPETEDPRQFHREARTIYRAAAAGGHIDANKREFRLEDEPEEFSPLMNIPHGLGLELLGLLLTVNTWYQDKDINLGQLKHFIEGGDIFKADAKRGFKRAGLLHLAPDRTKAAPATQRPVASINNYRRVDREARQGREFTSVADLAREIAGSGDDARAGFGGRMICRGGRQKPRSGQNDNEN